MVERQRPGTKDGLRFGDHPVLARSVKTYQGTRDIDGLNVTVDGRRLPEHYEIKQFTKWGFEWTYEGASPQQLAFAILYDHLGDKDRAIKLSKPFMRKVIADLDNDWTLTAEEIERAIADMDCKDMH
ncbi:MAG: DUF6166 domain-containing protein [Xanthobacteraceae bacterium]